MQAGSDKLLSVCNRACGSILSNRPVLDAADYFINQFGITIAALFEIIIVAWVLRKLQVLQSHADMVSDIRLGAWWRFCLMIITPIVLGTMIIQNIMINVKENYEGYSTGFLLYSGYGVALAAVIFGFVMMSLKWRNKNMLKAPKAEEVSESCQQVQ